MIDELRQAIEQSTSTATVVMIVILLVGLTLWLMGKKIARQSIAVSGLIIGGVAGFPLSQQFSSGAQMTLAWIIAGAVIGCLVAWLIYRVWMGVSMGALLAIIAPIVYVIVIGTTEAPPTPPTDDAEPQESQETRVNDTHATVRLVANEDTADAAHTARDDAKPSAVDKLSSDAADQLHLTDEQRDVIDKVRKTAFEKASAEYAAQREALMEWWRTRSSASQYNLRASVAIGALLGLLLGLLTPNVSASFQTALIGTLLASLGAWGLLVASGRDPIETVPFALTPVSVLLALSLITHLGIAVQWTIWRQKSDT